MNEWQKTDVVAPFFTLCLSVLDCPFVVLNAVYPLLYPGIIVSEQQHVRSATVCIVAAILGYQVVQYRRKSQVGLRGGFLWSHFTKYESTTLLLLLQKK